MPVELLLLFGLAGAGVLLSVAMLCVNMAMAQRARRLAPDPEELPAAEEAVEATQAPQVQAPEADGLPQTAMRTAAEAPERTQPIFSPLDRSEGGAVLGGLRVQLDNAQEKGTRAEQQDAFAITPLEEPRVLQTHGVMAVVCDGMGGLEGGARAANTAAVQFMRAYLDAKAADGQALHQALLAANEKVFALAGGKEGSLGTTLVAAAFSKNGLWFISVGDSHIYLHRNNKLYQLNRDHNYYAVLLEKVEEGTLSLEEARKHPERAHLTSYLGQREPALVDANAEPLALRAGDRVVLCSDGLFKTLPAAKMQQILSRCRQGAAQELVRAVMEAGKPRQDNVTAVVLYMDQV